MSNTQVVTADRGKKIGLYAGAGLVTVVALYMLVSVIWTLVMAGMGLAALGVIAAGGITAYKSMDLLGQKLENRILKARKQEARENEEETLDHAVLRRSNDLASAKAAIEKYIGLINSSEAQVLERKKTNPKYDATLHLKRIQACQAKGIEMTGRYVKAYEALQAFKEKVADYKFDNQIGNVLNAANQSIGNLEGGDPVDLMLENEAFASIRENFNTAFASLDMDIQYLNSTNTLSLGDRSNVLELDMSAVQVVRQGVK